MIKSHLNLLPDWWVREKGIDLAFTQPIRKESLCLFGFFFAFSWKMWRKPVKSRKHGMHGEERNDLWARLEGQPILTESEWTNWSSRPKKMARCEISRGQGRQTAKRKSNLWARLEGQPILTESEWTNWSSPPKKDGQVWNLKRTRPVVNPNRERPECETKLKSCVHKKFSNDKSQLNRKSRQSIWH
jgi:hypothetical protein